MIALDAKTGVPVASFGSNGQVDLAQGLHRPVDRDYYTMSSPPVIVRDVIVVGSSLMDWRAHRPSPPGDVRGFDARTGQHLWTFHTVPQAAEQDGALHRADGVLSDAARCARSQPTHQRFC